MSRPPVLVPHQLAEESGPDLVEAIHARDPDVPIDIATSEAETLAALEDAAVLLTYEVEEVWLDRAPNLEWIQILSAGVDHVDLDAVADAGVRLTNGSGVHAEPIAQQVLCYLFLFERRVLGALRRQSRREWERHEGEELADKTVGIVGVGAIGNRVAERANQFGAVTIGTKRDPRTGAEAVDECFGPDGLEEVLARSDYLVIACPLTEETRGMIGETALAAMDDDAVLVNIARGEIVDESALADELAADGLRGAALDAFAEEPLPEESPLWGMENVVVTPHTGGSSQFLEERLAELIVENYAGLRAGESLENRVV